ncbi:tyrosine-type recombinase/integrase [Streptomyces sp. QHH-9511]|uniref:tyrosine-type recombinase/integrase n=1 Tax=Streptomyces sp. QHH-9511 TaxID=2684468 RepID=UPI001E33446B|nr:tyrosine-type recombinase/integrase [Streptomyces sp. QHH-9511]
MTLAVVRSIGAPRRLETAQEYEDFEQELVDQFLLAGLGAGLADSSIEDDRRAVFEFVRFLGRPVWTAGPEDADRFLTDQRRVKKLGHGTVQRKAWTLAQFFDFLIVRYQGDVHALTGHVLVQPIDEFNRPAKSEYGTPRIPPAEAEVDQLFTGWRESLGQARKFLPAARDYMVASLWRRVGTRMTETLKLDIRDWRPDLGDFGKLHIRHGKGSRGRGPKPRLVPAINSTDALMDWWLGDVRHQFGDDYAHPDAPMFPSERRDPMTGFCGRAGDDALRSGLKNAVDLFMPAWSGRLTPHVLRHFCASSLYLQGVNLRPCKSSWATNGCPLRPGTSTCTTTTSNRRGQRRTNGSRPVWA